MTTTTPSPGLGPAVATALKNLGDLGTLPAAVQDGRVEQMLRSALATHESHQAAAARAGARNDAERYALAAAAVRAACAHLATRSLEDAYLALRAAADHLHDGWR